MNIIPNHLRNSHLQNIIDQFPGSNKARMAKELMEKGASKSIQYSSLQEYLDDYSIAPQSEIGKGEVGQ